MRYLIVCGGKIDKEFGLNEIKTDGIDAIIAADSGMDFLYENGVTPDIIVGDFDSARQSLGVFERKGSDRDIPQAQSHQRMNTDTSMP